jgi:acetaldehyde dehydrogenase (acetylating)
MMRLMIASLVVLIASAAARPGSQAQAPAVKTTTTGVAIDVTVVDKNGQPVADLQPADFELTEDGARQEIASGAGWGKLGAVQ